MGANSSIEWTDHTFNPWIGCTKVSPGCDHCYAENWSNRYKRAVWGPGQPRQRTGASAWQKPVILNERAGAAGKKEFVFCASLADVFDNEVPPAWRLELFDLIRSTPNLIWLLLTKRIGNVEAMMQETGIDWQRNLPNARLGATIVNQDEAYRDVPKLLMAKYRLRIPKVFLSVEPMLGPIELDSLRFFLSGICANALESTNGGAVDWVICGGESGSKARPMHPKWATSLRDQCAAAGVPFFFKQWGEWIAQSQIRGDQRLADLPNSYPIDIDTPFARAGKRAAGRQLDGIEHNGRPQP